MKDIRTFGTAAYPLHPSGLAAMVRCPWKVAMAFLTEADGEAGAAADTGSAAHSAIAAMHRGLERADSLAVMQAGRGAYPQADLREAASIFLAYAADPRNRDAKIVYAEEPVAFAIAASPEDPTQEAIQVIGTLDQVREVDGRLTLWDVKTSKKDGVVLLRNHTVQAAAYCVGASMKLKRPVHPGGLILPRRYRPGAAPGACPVFWPFVWTLADVEQILEPVRHVVAAIRRGALYHVPGDACDWCHAKSPDMCLPALQRTLKVLRHT